MKKKSKMGQTPKWLAVGVAALLIVGGIYAISNSTGNLAGNNKQLGAVAAGVSSQPKAGGVSASTASAQPVVTVTSWPSFNMKFDTSGNEKNLVVKIDYSITAKNGKIFIPTTWSLMYVTNSLNQYAGGSIVTVTPIESISTTNCSQFGICYEIPTGKTVNFTLKQTYNPAVMFGGIYTAVMPWFYFTTSKDGGFYYQSIPAQTSKLNTITIVGEKSPYLYTTAIEVARGQNFTIKGVRLNGSTPFMEGSDAPGIVSRDDSSVTFNGKLPPPGVYRLYFSHPTYGNSNNAWVTVRDLMPDLTITNFFATTTGPVYPGQYVAVRFTMTNVGTYIANPAHYFYSNQADGYSVMNTDNTCTASTSLLPGQSCLSSISFKFGTEGYKNMEVTLDPNNEVFESNENNNRANLMISVSSKG